MKVTDIWQKLGILRYGSKSGTFTSYKNMPDELMYDNVYDKEKDLTSKQDYEKMKKFLKRRR